MKRFLFWIPALAWAGFIFYLSTRPFGPKPSWWFNNADKVIHGTMFGILSLLMFLAFRKGNGVGYLKAAILAFVITVLYGSTDELHQFFTPSRTPDFGDLLADAVGASTVFLGLLKPRGRE